MNAIRAFLAQHAITPCPIIAAVSGGVDSTALLLALCELREDGFTIAAAHVNHHLRGTDSDEDEAFVRDLCRELDVELHVADGTLDPALVRERGIEAAARAVRYERLTAIRAQTNARYIATAHQKDDQAETILMRLLTGSGMAGLRGIHPIRDDGFIRPLLDITRETIEAFLRERGITPRHDRSNDDPRFLRNRVRVIVRELNATDNLSAIADQAREQWPILERAIDDAERECIEADEETTLFRKLPDDQSLRASLLQRHIRRLDPSARDFDAQRIANEIEGTKRITVTKTLEITRTPTGWLLHKQLEKQAPFEVPLTPTHPAKTPTSTIHIKPIPRQLPTANRQPLQLPPNATPEFAVRNRRPGDRFHPLGFPGAKKLKDFLIDRKIPREVRDRLPLLIWNGEIVWVAGVEISERFKVTESAGELYEVWMEDASAADDDHAGIQR